MVDAYLFALRERYMATKAARHPELSEDELYEKYWARSYKYALRKYST